MPNEKRSFLFLQGPLSPFFRRLGQAIAREGAQVNRVNFCGGDVFYWPRGNTHSWQGHMYEWPQWVAELMKQYRITDLVLIGDWRPLHREAIWLAKFQGCRIWVYEEGYIRPGYITLEEGGVNAYSQLPRSPEDVHRRALEIAGKRLWEPSKAANPMLGRILKTAWNHVGNVVLWSLFHRYRTHRPYNIGRELIGHIPRLLNRSRRRRHGISVTKDMLSGHAPFYLMPLQLDADSQVRRHSPFTGMLECMALVITDFARNAPKDTFLVFKNHPLDNGLRNYRRYMRSLGRAAGCSERLRFVEEIKSGGLITKARGIILCNSTVGMMALLKNKPVYCLGESIYAMPGLAVNEKQMPLAEFWTALPPPDKALRDEFFQVIRHDALIPGNFYSPEGIDEAIAASLERMGLTGDAAGKTEEITNTVPSGNSPENSPSAAVPEAKAAPEAPTDARPADKQPEEQAEQPTGKTEGT